MYYIFPSILIIAALLLSFYGRELYSHYGAEGYIVVNGCSFPSFALPIQSVGFGKYDLDLYSSLPNKEDWPSGQMAEIRYENRSRNFILVVNEKSPVSLCKDSVPISGRLPLRNRDIYQIRNAETGEEIVFEFRAGRSGKEIEK